MSDQAASQDDDLLSEENVDEAEVEIVLENEETPSSESVPLKSHVRQREKWKKQRNDSLQEVERLKRENELLKLSKQPQTNTRPRREDYEDEDAYEAARDDYLVEQTREATAKVVDQRIGATREDQVQSQRQKQAEDSLDAHYERAEKLKVSDYEAAEDAAIEILGQDKAAEIISALDRSEVVMYHLGKHPEKARAIKELIDTNPVKGTLALGRLEAELKVKPKSNKGPDPETQIEGGSTATTSQDRFERQLDKMRDDVAAGKKNMEDLLALKKQAPSME